jgi:hypothetical protein
MWTSMFVGCLLSVWKYIFKVGVVLQLGAFFLVFVCLHFNRLVFPYNATLLV